MGKVLRTFTNGFPGAVSRSVDNVIAALKNAAGAEIPFGAPVFLADGEKSCVLFNAQESTPESFLGFAVRIAAKTPEVYGSDQSAFTRKDPVEVLLRGSVVLRFDVSVSPGDQVYIRKSDGKLVVSPGSEGSTVRLPGVTVRSVQDSAGCAETVVARRNLI